MKTLTFTLVATLHTSLVFAQDQLPPRREPGDAQRPPPTERREAPPGDEPRQRDLARPDTDRPPGGLPPVVGGRVGGPEIEHRRPDVRPGKHVSRDYLIHAPDPIPPKPQAFLGVVTGPLEPALSAQLGLSEGVGLVVQDVLPDSPAANAGVQKHDVLKQLNDQLLTSPNQLATLVRHLGKEKDVTLGLVRQGQEQKVSVKIGERMMPDRGPFLQEAPVGLPRLQGHLHDVQRNLENVQRGLKQRTRAFEEQQRAIEGKARALREHVQPGEAQPPSALPAPPPNRPGNILRHIGPKGAPEVNVSQDQVSTTWNTANARVLLKNEHGAIEVRSDDGKRTLIARDARDQQVFKGPINTEAELQSVPPEFRKMLEKVDVQSQHGEKGIVVSRAAANPSPKPTEPPPVEEPVASDAEVQ